MRGMFRFSLSTLLICIFIAAVVWTYCVNIPVKDEIREELFPGIDIWVLPRPTIRAPRKKEIIERLAWSEPLALVATLLAIQGIRKIWRSIPRDKNRDSSSDPPIG